jgi:hypothetical protein
VIRRTVLLALFGAFAGVVVTTITVVIAPALTIDFGQELPVVGRGFYAPERAGDVGFAWTSSRADLTLRGLDRTSAWSCALRFRGARADPRLQPQIQVVADGVALARATGSNDYQTLPITIPTKARSGLILTISVAPTMVPGTADRRELGVQVETLVCRPERMLARPPTALLTASALSSAAFAGTLGALGLTTGSAIATILVVATVQAVAMSSGLAPYSPYLWIVPRAAFWIALVSGAGAMLLTRWRGNRLDQAARMAIAFSAGALLLELVALLHPSKATVDAVFHAHRLQWVLDGRYYFTQPMPDGVRFPYAIALYIVAAPWSFLTTDFVSLLKIVVSASRAAAGLALYPMTVRAWGDRSAGVISVVLFHLVPLPFIVIGNANMTFAFGQSMAVLTLAAVAAFASTPQAWLPAIGLFVLASVAFLSHVGIFPLLLASMMATAAVYWWRGGATVRPAAWRIAVAGLAAAVLSVVLYYGHFPESYATLQRVRGDSTAVTETGAASSDAASTTAKPAPPRMPRVERLQRAARIAVNSFGWPITLLAVTGGLALWVRRSRDTVTLLCAACLLVYCGFVGFSALSPIEPRFQRYSEEFISRVNFAMTPIAVVLAARGTVWAWRRNLQMRAATVVVATAALIVAAREWLVWIR